MTSVALSISSVVNDILAQTALRHYLRQSPPPLLTQDRKPAIQRLCINELSSIAAEINAHLAESDPDIPVLLVGLPQDADIATFRKSVERAVAASVIAQAYIGIDDPMAEYYITVYHETYAIIRAITSRAKPALIRPWTI